MRSIQVHRPELDWHALRTKLAAWRGRIAALAVLVALAMNPALVLADEPTGNLDTKSAEGVFELMRKVNLEQGTTFLIVTHNHDLASRCERIIDLVDGRMVGERRLRGGAHV